MDTPRTGRLAPALLCLIAPFTAHAQTFEAVGTRAAGMGGAFVGVADDASAVYWNPGGLAAGSYFSFVFDRGDARTTPDDPQAGGSRSATLLALAAPALGLSYYRLRSTAVTPPPDPSGAAGAIHVQTLTTHNAGVTVVQSLADGLAIGATLRLVRGRAGVAVGASSDRDGILDNTGDGDVIGSARTAFDADVGVMATFGSLRAGVTVRNLAEPSFDLNGGGTLTMDRQARAGVSVNPWSGWIVAADLDLTKNGSPLGEVRNLAVGAEIRVVRRAFARAGVRVNTVEWESGRAAGVSVGGSFAASAALLVDAAVTTGSDGAERAWGVAGRVVF